jgi:hypothetical protein
MIQENAKNSITFWPEAPQDGDMPELPIVIEIHSSTICIQQENRYVMIHHDNVEEFIKALRKAVKTK